MAKKKKTYKTMAKRFKKTNPKRKKAKLLHSTKGRGSKHLMTKKSGNRKLRMKKTKKLNQNKEIKKVKKLI